MNEEDSLAVFRWVYYVRMGQWRHSDERSEQELFKVLQAESLRLDIAISDEIVQLLSSLCSSEALHGVHNAQRLAYNAEHIFVNSDIIIDVRPVFNKSKDEIIGNVVMPFLKVTFTESGEEKNVSVLMDASDIDALTFELDKARKKISIIKSKFDESSCFLTGEEIASNV